MIRKNGDAQIRTRKYAEVGGNSENTELKAGVEKDAAETYDQKEGSGHNGRDENEFFSAASHPIHLSRSAEGSSKPASPLLNEHLDNEEYGEDRL